MSYAACGTAIHPRLDLAWRGRVLDVYRCPGCRDDQTRLASYEVPGGTGQDALVFTSTTELPLRHGLFYRRHLKPVVAARPAMGLRPATPGALPPDKQAVRFHGLRHTYAALSIATGAHSKLISARLWHSSIAITPDRCGYLVPSVEEALADALDAAFTASGVPSGTAATVRPSRPR
jgi:hypothetical protein